MKSFLFNLGSQILRDALAGQGGAGAILSSLMGAPTAAAPRPAPRPDFAYLTRFGKRLLTLTAVGFVASLFFVMGTMTAINAAAQSIDLFGVFVASAVFYTGLTIAVLGGLGALVCVSRARRHSFSWEFFFRHADEAVTMAAYEPAARANYDAGDAAGPVKSGHAMVEAGTPPGAFAPPSYAKAPEAGEPRRPGPERIAS